MNSLAQYDRVRSAIAQVGTIDDALDLIDEFEIAKVRAKQIRDQALLADASEFQLRAERRLGEVIRAARDAGLFKSGRQAEPEKSTEAGKFSPPRPTLEDAGIDKHLSSRAQGRAKISDLAFEQMVQATRDRIASGRAKIINAAPPAHTAGRVTGADDLDYSPTPPWATRALFEHVLPAAGNPHICSVWEPACGEGHIAEVLREYVAIVRATDIHDYGYGDALMDFLHPGTSMSPLPDLICTNPPFEDRVLKFMLRALELSGVAAAMFLQLRYLEGVGRYNELFKDRPPTIVAPFVERVPLLMGQYDPKASTTTAFMWLVWIHGENPKPPLWIPPGQREALTRPDDVERFTTHPVRNRTKGESINPETGEVTGEAA